LTGGFKLHELNICEDLPVESPFQILYQDRPSTWTLLPNCQKESFGGEYQIFDETISSIGSWTVALATIEEFFALVKE
jgi:hypothetical protein